MSNTAERSLARPLRLIASVLLAFFLLYRFALFALTGFHGLAWDFSINWTAALGWREGLALYDRPALQALAIARIDSGMAALFTGRFTAFVGLPTTALLHLPFTALPYDSAVLAYRSTAVLAMLAAVFITGLALPPERRTAGWVAGLLCLATWHAFPFSIRLGQIDAWVMLALATTVWAARRERWALAGVAAGLAVLLKISPVWLLLAALLQRQWGLLRAAIATGLAGLALAALLSRHQELLAFFTTVLPSLGDSPLHVQNQSLGACLARLTQPGNHLLDMAAGIGAWKYAASLAALGLLLAAHRRWPAGQTPELLAFAILPALLAGPLTWDHYLAWALVPVMLLAAALPWQHWPVLALGLLPLAFPVPYPTPEQVAASAGWRWLTVAQGLSLLVVALGAMRVWQASPGLIKK